VFRAYRESYEEHKVALEQRFRGLLEESLEDAIYLAAVNSELKLQVQDLRQGKNKTDNIATLKGEGEGAPGRAAL
jgi:hypothetical protein